MTWQTLLKTAATNLAKRRLAERATAPTKRRRPTRGVVLVAAMAAVPVGLVGLITLLAVSAVVGSAPAAAGVSVAGIPPVVFSVYLQAQIQATELADGCVVDWPVIAGIWKVESDHATVGNRTVTPEGQVTPRLFGVTLDGSTPGTATIPDSDDGVLDGDPVWDRAVGPAQFLPGSWASFGQDANNDGVRDPQNVHDAALATVAHLCIRTPGDYTTTAGLDRALRGYNNSQAYVVKVAGWVDYYRSLNFDATGVVAVGHYAFPLPPDSVTPAHVRRTHHDYPASDLMVPEGTPVYAAHTGTVTSLQSTCPGCRCGYGVTISGLDDHQYTYCHGLTLTPGLQVGSDVAAGALIMMSGNTGNSTAPHLHFQIRNPDGDLICPQQLLAAWQQGIPATPLEEPTQGCTH